MVSNPIENNQNNYLSGKIKKQAIFRACRGKNVVDFSYDQYRNYDFGMELFYHSISYYTKLIIAVGSEPVGSWARIAWNYTKLIIAVGSEQNSGEIRRFVNYTKLIIAVGSERRY
jgi:hypothetical protein